MADDESGWLPKPPPPRPARREDAIHAALRKFDGAEDASASRRPKAERTAWRRPQFAVALSAMLLVVVGIPAALIGIRNQDVPPAQPSPSAQYNPPPSAPALETEAQSTAPASVAPAPEAPPAAPPAKRTEPLGFAANDQPAAEREVPAMAAAPPPPPQPPPPPPAAAQADSVAEASGELIVTGSRVRQPNLAARAAPFESQRTAKARPDDQSYEAFLSRLQGAVRTDDRRAIIELISFPLRVNFSSGSRQYRDARSVERDFDRIFTPKVKRAVLAQSPRQLFSRDIGAMVGDGELWFDHRCLTAACSSSDAVQIIAVNP